MLGAKHTRNTASFHIASFQDDHRFKRSATDPTIIVCTIGVAVTPEFSGPAEFTVACLAVWLCHHAGTWDGIKRSVALGTRLSISLPRVIRISDRCREHL